MLRGEYLRDENRFIWREYGVKPSSTAELEFDPCRMYGFSEGLCRFEIGTDQGRRFGFIDLKGEVVIGPVFQEVGRFSEGLAKYAVNVDWVAYQKALDEIQKNWNDHGFR